MRYYPKGFFDTDYLDLERGYKWTAHERWSSDLSKGEMEGLLRARAFGEIAARLWDVMPSGGQRLISRGIWRIGESEENTTSTITFQLHGNGYEFPKGDTVKLQLLGRDAPYYRASNGAFSIEATNVTISLPTS